MTFKKSKYILTMVFGGLLIGFIAVSFAVVGGHTVSFDRYVTQFVQSFETEKLTIFLVFITHIGSYRVEFPVLTIVSVYWLLNRNKLYPLALLLNLVGVQMLNRLIKELFVRERPLLEHLVTVNGYSFPSGHAMISTAFYGFLTYLVCQLMKMKWYSYIFSTVMGILIVLIGISRIYLGVHYPSDVVGGFLMGGSILIFAILQLNKFQKLLETSSSGGAANG